MKVLGQQSQGCSLSILIVFCNAFFAWGGGNFEDSFLAVACVLQNICVVFACFSCLFLSVAKSHF